MQDPDDRIDLYLDGPAKGEQRRARLLDFNNVCHALRNTLRHVERCLTGDAPAIEYEIVDLAIGSASLATAPTPNGVSPRIQHEVVQLHKRTVRDIQEGRPLHPRIDYRAIAAFRGFGSPLRREGATVAVGGTELTADYQRNVEKLLEPISSAVGSVQGLLEDLHLHKRNRFVLYPMGDDDSVMCDFHPRLYEKVLSAMKKNVTVVGTLHYGLGKAYPVRVDVDDLEPHPSDDDLPSLLDMCGSMVDTEGDSVSIVRAMRNEW